MTRGVSRELRREIHSVLGTLVGASPATFIVTRMDTPPLERDATNYLNDIGAFERTSAGNYRLTAFGREYWDRINRPKPINWLSQNWFPSAVALATIAASVGGIVVNALD